MKDKLEDICKKIKNISLDCWEFETEGKKPYYNLANDNGNYFERYTANCKNGLTIIVELGGNYKIDFSVDTHQRYKYDSNYDWKYSLQISTRSKNPILFTEIYDRYNQDTLANLYQDYLEEKVMTHILEKREEFERKKESKDKLKMDMKINKALAMF